MKISKLNKIKPKDLIVFDLDGTLTQTKSQMDEEMTTLVFKLLKAKKVAVIGGGKYQLFQHQFLSKLKGHNDLLKNLSLFPTTSTAYYHYHKGWKKVYEHKLTLAERKKILATFHKVLKEINYRHPKKTFGKTIEDRGTQITWSALGQDVVKILGKKGIALKEAWKRKNTSLKLKVGKLMAKYLPNLEVRAAGHTSVDVTKKGIDKAYGLRQIQKYLRVPIKKMLFVGDAIFPGGNDYAIVKTGVDYIPVKNPADTKKIIRHLLA